MADRYLLDTDVIIEYLRGQERAVFFLEQLEAEIYLSAITVGELYSGVKGVDEEEALEAFLLAFEVIPVDQEIAKIGGLYRKEFQPSHGTGLADALIAATANLIEVTLITFNKRHFPMLADVEVPYTR